MLSVDIRPRRRNSHKAAAEKRCEPFLKWLRTRICILEGKLGHVCIGKVRACHVDYAGDKGMGTKVSDKHAVPMCDGGHCEQHRIGWRSFEARHGIDALGIAALLYRVWPGRAAWERKLEARS